jgi:hypothetical protein
MRRSSGRDRTIGRPGNRGRTWPTALTAAAILLAALATPAGAGNPRAGSGIVTGGGDDPGVVVEPSAADLELIDWKLAEAARLRAAGRRAAPSGHGAAPSGRRAAPSGHGAGPAPQMIAPCTWDCPPPSQYALESYARQQINAYYCGPAAAQVIINRTRGYFFADKDGEKTATNYRKQSTIGAFMGTDSNGSTAWMVKSGLNQYADLAASGSSVAFSVVSFGAGSDFHWAMVIATWDLVRGAAVPIQMTYDSQHLASWSSSTWWTNHKSWTIRHWISIYGYDGLWDGTYGPQLYYTDSSAGLGGQTGTFRNASRLVFNLNQANSGRVVY